ncbi:SpaA isopeptide-forming pilin-related protein [Bifidobacterium aerophilum]|uniref:Cell surface protein n=1 Tax=Bifidobacterium aerophilum TaxID=1798155 RepID=A0A6N9Z234_9BIFI|nr:SpaA isopeptide-forming pilin-related protein [Bifidobacterium aerophilum]NEG88679.1 cell surface protein [Bifidobacterium aerophilum]
MKLRKLFAGVAAAATLLGGFALGAATANAADPADISGKTITVTATDANQFYTKPFDAKNPTANLRTFKYVELAKYVTDGNTGVALQGVATGDQVTAAFQAIGYDATKDDYKDQWIWLGNNTLTADQTTAFVNALKPLAQTDIVPAPSANGTSQTFTLPEGGLYLIVDQSGKLVLEDNANHTLVWNGNTPILAGTEIKTSDPKVEGATGALASGKVDLKSSKMDTAKADAVTWQKVDKTFTGLAGSTFNVYEGTPEDLSKATPIKFVGQSGIYNLPYEGETGAVADLTSDGQGNFTLYGLKRGTVYTVVEKSAPTGYNNNFKGSFTVTVGTDGKLTFAATDVWKLAQDHEGKFVVVNVKNISQLPLTGAAGTALFSVIAVLIAGAAATVFAKSRSTKRALNA